MRIKRWVAILSLAGCAGTALHFGLMAIYALFNSGTIEVEFNRFNENLIEAILFPIFTILGIWGITYLTRKQPKP